MKRPKLCYIFDVDGTLADLTHRHHHIAKAPKDWEAFKRECVNDKPITHIVDLARTLYWAAQPRRDDMGDPYWDVPYEVILMSGRNECQRDATMNWLADVACLPPMKLYMRADGDFRADDIIKAELLQRARRDGYVPIMAFDDRDRVVAMWRANGIPCAQVAPGDF